MKVFNRPETPETLVVKRGSLLFGRVTGISFREGKAPPWQGCLLRVRRVLPKVVVVKVIQPPLRYETFPVGRRGEVLGIATPLLTSENFVLVNRPVTLQTVAVQSLKLVCLDETSGLALYRDISVHLRFFGLDGQSTVSLPVGGLVGFYSTDRAFALTSHAAWQLFKAIYEAGIEAEACGHPLAYVNARILEQIVHAEVHRLMDIL
jgi:hypothetical protein